MAKTDALAAIRRELATKRGARKTAWQELERRKHAVAKAGSRGMSPSSPSFRALDAAGRNYDTICDEIASQERVLAHMAEMNDGPPKDSGVSLGATAAKLFGTPRGVDADAFMAAFKAWSSSPAMAGVIASPHLPFGRSDTFPLIAKQMFAAAVSNLTYPTPAYRVPGAESLPQPNLALLGLIKFVPTEFDRVEYMCENVLSADAVETAEGDAAAEAVVSYESRIAPCRSIPLHLPATRQVLSDAALLEQLVSGQLVNGVMQRVQAQCIAGNGEGENLLGIVNWPDVLVQDMGNNTIGDVIQRAVNKIRTSTLSMYEPDILLLHPNDALGMGLAQDDDHGYIFSPAARYAWGLQPIAHSSVPEGSPIVGATSSCSGYVREDVSVAITKTHLDHFARGIVDFRADGRWAFAVRCPSAWCLVADFQS
jgi:HK97 family phage major capsid protein